ncbi:MAG: hypothetical protein M1836_005704 [Candelina mexicana]|nr:MAG: hypothetical protein M1836_005704 [Candelina mexicana]
MDEDRRAFEMGTATAAQQGRVVLLRENIECFSLPTEEDRSAVKMGTAMKHQYYRVMFPRWTGTDDQTA